MSRNIMSKVRIMYSKMYSTKRKLSDFYGLGLPSSPLDKIFNHILDKRTLPKQWSKGIIIPMYKKGDTQPGS